MERYSFYTPELLGIIGAIVAVAIVVLVLYLLNLQHTLKEVSEHNRQILPGRVWLMLIPLFSAGYAFYLYPKISESLRLEFEERENPQTGDYAKNLGLALAILGAVSILNINVLDSLVDLANLIILIVYWVKMANYKNILRRGHSSGHADLLD